MIGINNHLFRYNRNPILIFLLVVSSVLLFRFSVSSKGIFTFGPISYNSNNAVHYATPLPSIVWSPNVNDTINRNLKLNRTEILRGAVNAVRSLPRLPFVAEYPPASWAYNESCARYPSILDIQFTNAYWQIDRGKTTRFSLIMERANTSWGVFFMYGAYFDNRSLSIQTLNGPVVRILGVMDKYFDASEPKDFCHLWFEEEDQPVITDIVEQNYIFYTNKTVPKFASYIFTCPIPTTHHHKVPKSVSVVRNPCDNALNSLGVQYEKPESRKKFAVCIKAFDFPHEDLSLRLIEWIEINRVLGAEKIFFYRYKDDLVHANVSKVFDYYERSGFVDVTPYSLPGDLPDEPNMRHFYLQAHQRKPEIRKIEIIPYNDCLYRNLYSYEYLAVIDIDEIVMPLKNASSWFEIVNVVKKKNSKDFQNFGAICFQNVYFFEEWLKNKPLFPNIPSYMYHLQHVYRGNNNYRRGLQSKCLHIVDKVLTLYNHAPIKCLNSCRKLHIQSTQAQLQHYKPKCPSYLTNCSQEIGENPILDTAIWRYKDQVIYRAKRTMKTLGFSID